MRAVLLRSLVVIAVGGVVLAGVLYVASTVDSRPPAVHAFTLTQAIPDEPSRALITTSLEVAFSEPVDIDSAAAALSIEPAVTGSISWSWPAHTPSPCAPALWTSPATP